MIKKLIKKYELKTLKKKEKRIDNLTSHLELLL